MEEQLPSLTEIAAKAVRTEEKLLILTGFGQNPARLTDISPVLTEIAVKVVRMEEILAILTGKPVKAVRLPMDAAARTGIWRKFARFLQDCGEYGTGRRWRCRRWCRRRNMRHPAATARRCGELATRAFLAAAVTSTIGGKLVSGPSSAVDDNVTSRPPGAQKNRPQKTCRRTLRNEPNCGRSRAKAKEPSSPADRFRRQSSS